VRQRHKLEHNKKETKPTNLPQQKTQDEKKETKNNLQSVGIEPTLLRTRALSVRLNRSAKTANAMLCGRTFDVVNNYMYPYRIQK
jgi:hypothetical protein